MVNVLHILRKARNKAGHEGWADIDTATRFLPVVYSLTAWFARTYGPLDLTIQPYRLTSQESAPPVAQMEQAESALQQQDETKAQTATTVARAARIRRTRMTHFPILNSSSNQLFRKSLTISQKRGLRALARAKFSVFSGKCFQSLNSALTQGVAGQALSPHFGLIIRENRHIS